MLPPPPNTYCLNRHWACLRVDYETDQERERPTLGGIRARQKEALCV